MRTNRIPAGLAMAAALALLSTTLAAADDKPTRSLSPSVRELLQKRIAGGKEAPIDKEAAAKAEAEAIERYKLPAGGSKELIAFIQAQVKFIPRNRYERQEHSTKGQAAIRAAAEKLRDQAGDEDTKLPGYQDAMNVLLKIRARDLKKASPAEKQLLANDVRVALAASANPTAEVLSAAAAVARNYETDNKDKAIELYREYGEMLVKNKNAKIAKQGAKMEGAARRLTLVGNAMQIKGTQVVAFDWDAYRGKVVLIDFWASWCGPCKREFPTIKRYYELYHERGFEVVGVSLDGDRTKLAKYLEENPLPWTIVNDGDWESPLAVFYGVTSIPRMILVDKEGKVVSTEARGRELGRHLEALLGKVEGAPDLSNETPETVDADSPTDDKAVDDKAPDGKATDGKDTADKKDTDKKPTDKKPTDKKATDKKATDGQ